MSKKVAMILTMLCVMVGGGWGCSYVHPGYVGVKVYMLGGDKGVSDHEILGVGRYWIGINERLYLFPTFQQNYSWTQSTTEGSPDDESIVFQTKEGMNINADVGISYSVDPTKVATLFQKFRLGIDEITKVYLRNTVRDAFTDISANMSVEDIYGEKKPELLKKVQIKIKEEISPLGINLDRVYLIGGLRLPPQVVDSLNSKIKATQDAMRTKNEIESAKAQAEKEIALAKGIAEANKIKSSSINETLIKWEAVQKWDGKLPQVSGGGAIPMLNLEKK